MKLFKSKKAFLDDVVDLGWTIFFITAVALLVYGYVTASKSAVEEAVADRTIDVNRDMALMSYLRTPVQADGKELAVIDWFDQILLKGGDTLGECRRILGPATNQIFLQQGGYSGYSIVVELEGFSSPVCEFRGGSQGTRGASIAELPSVFADKRLTIKLFSVEIVERETKT